jgi:hypothetical protein
MALTVSTLGATLTSTAAVEKLTFEVDEWEDVGGNLRSAPYRLKITVVSGSIGYEVVAKGATAPAMTNATLYTTTDEPIQTVFNPYSQDLYIKSTIGDTYSISSI